MRLLPLRSPRSTLFRAGFGTATSLLVVLAVACGGDKDGAGAKSPGTSTSGDPGSGFSSSGSSTSGGTPGSAAGGEGSSGASGSPGSSGAAGATTTTTQLGNGGDLQGAKLGGKSHTETTTAGASGPHVAPGGSAQEAGRSQKDIQTIVASRRDEARACYDKGLTAHPGIEGDLDVKWVIDPQGNVTDASIDTTKSQILEPSVGSCVVDMIKKIKFAASAKGFETRAHYPFNFHPKTFGGAAKDAGK